MQFKKFYHRYELFEITEKAFCCECYYAVSLPSKYISQNGSQPRGSSSSLPSLNYLLSLMDINIIQNVFFPSNFLFDLSKYFTIT